nr:immunoglobulin heavy chain junction region [Macaca mulatta]
CSRGGVVALFELW